MFTWVTKVRNVSLALITRIQQVKNATFQN